VRILSLKPAGQTLVHDDARRLLSRVVYPAAGGPASGDGLAALWRYRGPGTRIALPAVRRFWRQPVVLAKSGVALHRALSVLPQLRAWSPDWIHAHWATYPSTAAWMLSMVLGVPFSFTAHAHDIFLDDHLLANKYQDCRLMVTISAYNKSYLTAGPLAGAADKIRIIHCGVDPTEYRFVRRPRAANSLLTVGRLASIKGFPVLLEACSRLQQDQVPFHLSIVGDGPMRGELKRLAAALGLQGTVSFMGSQTQQSIRELMRQATVFALPCVVDERGDRDGIPVALMEAMASGLPVVTTDVSGIPELVRDDDTGLVVPAGQPAPLAAALARALGDGELRDRLASRARQHVETQFDSRQEASRLLRWITGGM